MKALTLWQPWASLVAFGEKRVETRCWTTKYRGDIAIHAAKTTPTWLGASRFDQDFTRAMIEITERHGWDCFYWPKSHWEALHHERARLYTAGAPHQHIDLGAAHGFGAILCIANLVAIEPTEKVRADLSQRERLFGNYEDGRYAWFLENVRRVRVPIGARGHQQLWYLDRELLEAIHPESLVPVEVRA
jgi:hypothetical protein